MSACKSCGAPIRWGVTHKGHRMPLDAEPSPDGTIVIGQADRISVLTHSELIEASRKHGVELFTSHFATCPNAARHRKRGRK